jgi:putative Mn2+ efflux pump MntP
MGIFSGLGSMISSAVSVVASAIGSIGGSLAASTSTFLKVAAPWLGTVIQVIQIVSMLLDILKPGDNVEEFGAKAMEADKKPEDFDSNAEYIDYLRNEVKLDQEKFDSATEPEKMARMAVGASIVAKGIEEKKGFDIPLTMWVAMAKIGLDDKATEIDKILETFKNGKLEDFVKYTEGKLDAKKELEIGDSLVDMYKELEPNMSEKDIENKVMKMDVGDK